LSSLSGAIRRIGLPLWKTRKTVLRNTPPIVSFTFDDFPRSALTSGGAILQRHNARGTYYTAMGLLGITNHEGEHFQMRDLHDLLRDGHELGSHTYGHLSALRTPLEKFLADALRGESELANLRGSTAQGNFAYAYGDVSFASKPAIGAQMRSCRGIRGGINAPFADLNLLKANSIYSKTFDLNFTERLIQENQRKRGWLIFYSHDIRDNPSDYGCTPSEFESVVQAASRGGAKLLTISQALDLISAASASDAGPL
jgi:peptidoglycan/xylan/chitin deacetylase (PgdA/CDA1 family)